jgi:hypothetical protein
MLVKNTYITEFESNGIKYAGQNIKATSFEEAQMYINCNGLGYLTITGKLFMSLMGYELN